MLDLTEGLYIRINKIHQLIETYIVTDKDKIFLYFGFLIWGKYGPVFFYELSILTYWSIVFLMNSHIDELSEYPPDYIAADVM